MKSKPLALKIYSLVLILIAVSFPIQIAFLYHHSIFELDLISAKLAPTNWIVMVGSLLTALLIFIASAWSYVFSFLLCYFVVKNNILVSELGNDYSIFTTSLASSMFFVFTTILFTSTFRDYILNENLRWWLTPKRFSTRLRVVIKGEGLKNENNSLEVHTHDISETGLFLAHPQLPFAELKGDYKIALFLTPKWTVHCEGEIVRTTQGHGRYPDGAGVRLMKVRFKDRMALKWMILFLGKER